MAKRILIRRDTTANWNSVNPILSNGELGIEIKTNGIRSLKLGTGSIPWNNLNYLIDNVATLVDLEMHKNDTTAHSAIAVPTANRIVMYNNNLGLKSDKVPVDLNDVIRKTELNNISGIISGVIFDVNIVEADLAAEIINRVSAISGVEYNVDVETAARISNVSGLQFDIDILGLQLDSEITNREDAVSGVIYSAGEDAANKANTAENNAKSYADDLALATQKWLPAVETSTDLSANPGMGTYLCRVITGNDYGVYQWIGTETNPSWTFFSDNLDFIDRIANPVTNNIPIITANGELIDGGESISGIFNTVSGWVNTKENNITAGTINQFYRGDKTWQALSKGDVGLSNADNTSDLNKPISTAVSGALNGKVDNSTLSGYYTKTEVDTLLNTKEPSKYISTDETAAQTYSEANPTIMVFYPEE